MIVILIKSVNNSHSVVDTHMTYAHKRMDASYVFGNATT